MSSYKNWYEKYVIVKSKRIFKYVLSNVNTLGQSYVAF